jgi:hypothetical protein
VPIFDTSPETDLKTEKITKKRFNEMAVFWVVPKCGLVEVYRRFRSACYLQQRVSNFTLAAVRTSNPA